MYMYTYIYCLCFYLLAITSISHNNDTVNMSDCDYMYYGH